MSEFKVGDRVRITSSQYNYGGLRPEGFEIGATGTVVRVRDHGVAIKSDYKAAEHAALFFRNEEVVIAPEEHLAEDEPDYGTSGETNLTYQASDVPNHRVEALFAAIQSYAGASPMVATAPDIVGRAKKFLIFLEGKDD